MAAAAVTLARGVDAGAVRSGLETFAGVEHRLEEVATHDGVLYVDDSKATNVASAVVGIESFDGGVHVILGGRGKGSDYAPLARPVRERCRAAYLVGETAAALRVALEDTGVPLHDCGDLERAVAEMRLRGVHNVENAMAAAAVTLARGVDPRAVAAALTEFTGVAHRLEEVARMRGVLYVDDSKATNVASAVVAIESFPPGTVHAILGGRGKGSDYTPLAEALTAHARAAYLIGEAAAEIGETLVATPVEIKQCGDLERAVAAASRAAQPGDVVLLSPATASYDQYRSFEERGDHFRTLVTGESRGG